ncbi:MAG: hypothetical protein MIO92_12550 [Methanosarcinaceae archaeon]|nr:hypothetical protein [Methanosarcinaceae archaeon]
MNELQLPSEYVPFETMNICGNLLINGKVPITIQGRYPFLVGKGDVPMIWLNTTRDGKEWNKVVEYNISLTNDISVNYFADGKSVLILGRNAIIVQAIKKSETTLEVPILDLRPLGFDFHGNKAGIYIGTNLFANNVFQNVSSMINIG